MNVKVDFKKLKAVPLANVLAHYGITVRRGNIVCPLPTHTSAKKETSFAVNEDGNYWQCFSSSCVVNRNGKKGGDALDFVKIMEGCSVTHAAAKMLEWLSETGAPELPTPQEKAPAINKPLAFQLKGIAYCEYLEKRGVSKELTT